MTSLLTNCKWALREGCNWKNHVFILSTSGLGFELMEVVFWQPGSYHQVAVVRILKLENKKSREPWATNFSTMATPSPSFLGPTNVTWASSPCSCTNAIMLGSGCCQNISIMKVYLESRKDRTSHCPRLRTHIYEGPEGKSFNERRERRWMLATTCWVNLLRPSTKEPPNGHTAVLHRAK